MNKEERIARYGIGAYKKLEAQSKVWRKDHFEEVAAYNKAWAEAHPEERAATYAASHAEQCRRGGKNYAKKLEWDRTGIQGEKNCIRDKHGRMWRRFKNIIAPGSQIHHEWLNDGTPNYRGVALVEADQHMSGDIDVIQILQGDITLFTEAEIMEQGVGI